MGAAAGQGETLRERVSTPGRTLIRWRALSAYEALETTTQTGIEFARSTARWFGVGVVANVGGHRGVARPLTTSCCPRNVSHQFL